MTTPAPHVQVPRAWLNEALGYLFNVTADPQLDSLVVRLRACLSGEGGDSLDAYYRNQCDGCLSHMPIDDGIHRDEHGRAYMMCQAEKYRTRPVSGREGEK